VADLFGIEAYTDSSKMMKRQDIEAVTICTWSTTLAAEAMKALRLGKHVLVEKPMANSIQEAQRIIELAKTRDRYLMVGFLMRFIPGVQRIKQAVEEGDDEALGQKQLTTYALFSANSKINRILIYPYAHLSKQTSENQPKR
jgi:predicted dehydrogenase